MSSVLCSPRHVGAHRVLAHSVAWPISAVAHRERAPRFCTNMADMAGFIVALPANTRARDPDGEAGHARPCAWCGGWEASRRQGEGRPVAWGGGGKTGTPLSTDFRRGLITPLGGGSRDVPRGCSAALLFDYDVDDVERPHVQVGRGLMLVDTSAVEQEPH
eukprot:611437-Prymnesium_polylepis.3